MDLEGNLGYIKDQFLNPFLFAMANDRFADEIRQEASWSIIFSGDIVLCSESKEQIQCIMERLRNALERRRMRW